MADRFRICIIDIGSRDYGINIVILNDNIMKMKRTFITAFAAPQKVDTERWKTDGK